MFAAGCCKGIAPDAYRVQGGFGCALDASPYDLGQCAAGGRNASAGTCCCAPGPDPSEISTTLPNVLVIGDSVSAGYTPALRAALSGKANVQHGPDNAGGGNADGVGYGALCAGFFARTPKYRTIAWDVITFNFGLHDGATANDVYRTNLTTVHALVRDAAPTAKLVYILTTVPDMGSPGNLQDQKVQQLNSIAKEVMDTGAGSNSSAVTVVDLHATMLTCGDACKSCAPHCGPDGYQYLVDHALAPAVKAAINSS